MKVKRLYANKRSQKKDETIVLEIIEAGIEVTEVAAQAMESDEVVAETLVIEKAVEKGEVETDLMTEKEAEVDKTMTLGSPTGTADRAEAAAITTAVITGTTDSD